MTSALLTAPTNRARSHGIDALRAIFALWVVFAHTIPWAGFAQGDGAVLELLTLAFRALAGLFQRAGETHPAVLGFIVLSGYCIHRTGFRESPDVRAYAIRRAFRIYPVYLAATLAGIAAFLINPQPIIRLLSGTEAIDAGCVAAKLIGISAILPPLHTCTFQGNAPLSTVMVEIWLYAAYPLLLLGLSVRRGDVSLWQVVGGIWLLGVLAITLMPALRPWWHNGSLPGFLLYWWIGAIAVHPEFAGRLRLFAWPILAAWLLLSIPLATGLIKAAPLVEIRKVLFALLIAIAIVRLDGARAKWLAWLAPLGLAGYSLYAFHAPVVYTLLSHGWRWSFVILAAVVVAIPGYLLIERPLMRLGSTLARSRATAPAPAGTGG